MPPPNSRRKPTPKTDYQTIAEEWKRAQRVQEIEQADRRHHDMHETQLRSQMAESQRTELFARRHSAWRARWVWTVGFWVWMLSLHAGGIFFFTSGFLLTRLVLDERSVCASPPVDIADTWPGKGTIEGGCWHPKAFDKAVVILIDALRYDFTVPVQDENHFHNAFPFMYETAVAQPGNAFLRPFIADPPTATLQRLKGLTTGTLPTFIDMGSNFAGTAIEEDNLLVQMRDLGRKIVHLGDDTWWSLFPGYFEANSSRAYDSFNVWDLHTVDEGVIEHIFPLMQPERRGEWDFLIGHFLGVDHAGHRYGPDHPAMTAKLRQMDDFVRNLTALVDEDTLLVVMGDHGMDAKGDHGGESDDEVEAALWMYAKRPFFGHAEEAFKTPPATAKERPVNQIDLVPTLALLLGIPIPYNNLGAPIEEAFIGRAPEGKKKGVVNWRNLAAASRTTAAGIKRYQTSYFATSATNNEDGAIDRQAGQFGAWWETAEKAMAKSDWQAAYEALSQYQAGTLQRCKSLWARFDIPMMGLGLAVMAAAVIVLLVYINSNEFDYDDAEGPGDLAMAKAGGEDDAKTARASKVDPISLRRYQSLQERLLLAAIKGGLTVAGITTAFRSSARYLSMDESPWTYIIAAGALGSVDAAIKVLRPGPRTAGPISLQALESWIASAKSLLPTNFWTWLAVVFTLGQSVGFASNSYTIWEDSILLYFLTTFGVCIGLASFRIEHPVQRSLAVTQAVQFVLLSRLASFSKLCRDEQLPYCATTFYASATSSTAAAWHLGITLLVAVVLPSVVRSYMVATRSWESVASAWVGKCLRGGLFLVLCYWVLDAADNGEWLPGVPASSLKAVRVTLAQLGLGLAFVVGGAAFSVTAPCVEILQVTAGARRIEVSGYGNAFGARYLLIVVSVLGGLILLSKPMGGGVLAVWMWQVLTLVEVLDANELTIVKAPATSPPAASQAAGEFTQPSASSSQPSSQVQSALQPAPPAAVSSSAFSPIGPIVLALMGNFYFFKTGHQAVLSSIQWDSAFIPMYSIKYPWSPLWVILNTFAAQVLVVTALPLLVFWKTDPKTRGLLEALSRGMAVLVSYFAVEALATMAWAGHLRRHLMLYRVFSPRFMTAATVLVLVDVVGLLAALPAGRANFVAVCEVFGWVD